MEKTTKEELLQKIEDLKTFVEILENATVDDWQSDMDNAMFNISNAVAELEMDVKDYIKG